MRYISDSEIAQHQHDIRAGVRLARTQYSVAGLRRLIGNTIIAFGTVVLGGRQAVQHDHSVGAEAYAR